MSKELLIERELKTINGELSSQVESISQKEDSFSLLYQKYNENSRQYEKRMNILTKYQRKLESVRKSTEATIKYQTNQLIRLKQQIDNKIEKCEAKLSNMDLYLHKIKQRKIAIKQECKELSSKLKGTIEQTENLSSSNLLLSLSFEKTEEIDKETENKLLFHQSSIEDFNTKLTSVVKKIAKVKRSIPFLEQQNQSMKQKIETENDKISMLQKNIQEYEDQSDNLRRSFHSSLSLSQSFEEFCISPDQQLEMSKDVSIIKSKIEKMNGNLQKQNNELQTINKDKSFISQIVEKKEKDLTETRNSLEALQTTLRSMTEKSEENRKKCLKMCLDAKVELTKIANDKLLLKADLKKEEENLQRIKKLLSNNLELFPVYLDIYDKLYKAQNEEKEFINKYGQLKVKRNIDEAIVINNEIFQPDTSYKQIEREAKDTIERVKDLRKQYSKLSGDNQANLMQIRIFDPQKAKEFDIQRQKFKLEEIEQNIEQAKMEIDMHKTNIERILKQTLAKIFSIGYNMAKSELENIKQTEKVSETSLAQWKEALSIVDFLPEEIFQSYGSQE